MTEVPLKEYIETQVAWLDRYFAARLEAINVSISKAEGQLNLRLEGMNEFRKALNDQSSHLAVKEHVELQLNGHDARLKSLEITRATGEGRAAIISALVSSIITAMGVGIVLFH